MSVELPRALRPWAEPLALFGEVVHDGVGRWLHPLRALLGPLVVPQSAASGDPDGYAGLHRRGSYERLLLSEWAVALEVPDEFLRRATSAEHMFLAPAYREPQSSHGSVALLDCGPRQLGTPRLAQLAALVVLRQRAEAGSATFQFGVLQDEQRQLGALEAQAIPRWLRQRTTQTAEAHLDDWRSVLEEQDAPDRWLVGGPELREAAARLKAGLLQVQPSPDDAEALDVVVWPFGAGPRGGQVTLPLPARDTCVRILRAPLAPRRPAPRTTQDARPSAQGLGQLSCDGRRWLIPRPEGGVSALHVPNTPAEPPGYAKEILPLPGCTVIGADIKGKRPVALCISAHGLLALRGSGLMLPGQDSPRSVGVVQETPIEAPESFRSHSGTLLPFFVRRADAFFFDAWILDQQQHLWELSLSLDPRYYPDGAIPWRRQTLKVRDWACRRLYRMNPDMIAWVSDSEHRVLSIPSTDDDGLIESDEQRAGCILGPIDHASSRRLRYAYPDGNRVMVHGFGGEQGHVHRPDGQLFGLFAGRSSLASPMLLFVAPDRQGIYQQGLGPSARLLFTASDPVAAIRHEPLCDKIIWRTEAGERGVYDLQRQAVLRRLAPDTQLD